jgi:hypothetical protein
LEIEGAMEKETPLLETPPTVTRTSPVVAPGGTARVMFELLQFEGAVETPLKVTVLDPCVVPKPEPVMVTGVPVAPDVGLSLVIPGPRVKLRLLLANPATVTTTGPLVAFVGTLA